MASPPKPWERAGAASAAMPSAAAPSVASTTPTAASPSSASSSSSSAAPPLPDRPSSLASSVNQNAAAYSRMGVGASPYASYGAGAYSSPYGSPYSSPYSRMGGMGGYGGMGGMYGGYGGYGAGMYGGGMYGGMGGMGGMPGNPNDPNSLTNRFNNGTAATFQMLEGIVTAFAGFAQMLESTYMATHSSFFAMVSVAEQFGNLRDTLGSILGIFTLMRWIRTLIAKITGRPPPADAMALTPAAFAHFEGRTTGPDGTPGPPRASRKPLFFFLAAAFGLPYLMSKMIRTMAASHEEEERRLQQQALEAQQPVDPSKLEFCRLLYDFMPQPASASAGMELHARKGDLVAVLSKLDPAGNASEWWQCRSRDGRQGYLPSTYLEVLKRPAHHDVKAIKGISASDSSRASSLTSAIERPEEGKKEYASADGMQRSHFYS
ncbi:hypothetical protein CDD82_6364 [Ophiocordyceps australis]|uniref:Peroxisomal membrane protein PEX13 n=1 Tax=Ophiocordyceps australis TaxID=1399860 RepID=A0A2C5YW51_9HYPO|nr:hypothetical protein CDD82_6364 [Ophiocordyceps australis]